MSTIEEEIQMIKTAHSRLFNQLKQLESDFNSLIVESNITNINLGNKIKELQEQLDNVTIVPKPMESFKEGSSYTGIISEIITIEQTEWKGKTFLNIELTLFGRQEIYKIFVLKGNKPSVGNRIRFTYQLENKLYQIKVL
jgi:hypothetical protein